MAGLKSVMFGDIQYQVSQPIRNESDGYFYQRAREITRDGSVESEFIFRSTAPNDTAGLIDPERGYNLAYSMNVMIYDFAAAAYRLVTVGKSIMSGVSLETSVGKLVKDGVDGVEYPNGLKVGYQSWSGTNAPWDPSTLKSDPSPQWAPGPIERLFLSTSSLSNQTNQYSNIQGLTVVDRTVNPDGGRTITAISGDGSTIVFHERADGVVDKVITRDPLGKETTEDNWGSNGDLLKKYYNTQNSYPYELDVAKGADGKVTGAEIVLDQRVIDAGGAIGQIFGSALGSALGGHDQLTRLTSSVVGGTIGGLIGQKFGLVVATSMAADLSKVSLTDVFASQNINIADAGLGAVSSFLTAELGNALKIPGFGGQLFNAATNSFTLGVLAQVKANIVDGLTFDAAIAAIDWSAAVSGAIANTPAMVGNVIGTFLGQLLVPAKSHAGAIGGQLLGAIGSFLLPGVGSLIGTILGTVIGDLFGNTPHPAATDLLDQADDHYAATHYQTSSSDGGAFRVPDQMADPALAIINGYLKAVNGAVLDHSKQVTIGYQTDPQSSYIIGVPSHPAAGVFFSTGYAVQAAAVDVLQHLEVIGGDLLLKRGHQNSNRLHRSRGATSRRRIRGDGWRRAECVTASMACIHERFA
jgi:hypothetical protein